MINKQKFLSILTLFCLFCGNNSYSEQFAQLPKYQIDRIVNAIEKIENSKKFPFGIKSININRDWNKARAICVRTVQNNWIRFQKQTKYKDFYEFLGSRYCPVQGDKTGLNKNWIRNLKKELGKSTKK